MIINFGGPDTCPVCPVGNKSLPSMLCFSDEFGSRNNVTLYFHTNLDSVYSIFVISVFDDIVEIARSSIYSTSSYRLITWSDGMGFHWIKILVMPLFCIDSTLDSGHYISFVLMPVAVLFIQTLRKAMFRPNNARSYIAGNVKTFFDV